MCGIAAILLCPQERSPDQWRMIRDVFTRNLIFNEDRGNAATGLAVTRANGDVSIIKDSQPASQFAQTSAYQDLLDSADSQTTLLLGHTRLPTKGDPACNGNNHPLQAGPVVGVHNGHISNDDYLFNYFQYQRQAEVDSEIIFQILGSLSPTIFNGNYLSAARDVIQFLDGQFTFIAWDARSPQRILVLKHQNPLCLHFHAQWNALIFSSRYIFLRKAFGHAVVTEALPHDQIMLFDADRLPELGNQPSAQSDLLTNTLPGKR